MFMIEQTTGAILEEANSYVYTSLKNNLPKKYIYHNYQHTLATVEAAIEIGEGNNLSAEELEIVQLAAWFHDIGYIVSWKNHEETSAKIALKFCKDQQYPAPKIKMVVDCILATQMPQKPTNLIAAVLCDADLINLGNKHYITTGNLLREEWAITQREHFSDIEWVKYSIDFLSTHQYHTYYARHFLGPQKQKNIAMLKQLLLVHSLTDQQQIIR